MKLTDTTSVNALKRVVVRPEDIRNQNSEVLESLEGGKRKQGPSIMKYGHGNLIALDSGIPTDITNIYSRAADRDFCFYSAQAIPSIEVKYPDGSFQRLVLDKRRPQVEFFYDIEPLKIDGTIVLVGGEDHSSDLVRLTMSSLANSSETNRPDHRFNIEFKGQAFNNVQILSVYDIALAQADQETNIGLILDDPYKQIEVSRGESVIVTRVQ